MNETFGQALRRIRSARAITQEQLGKLVYKTGGYISDLERGRRHAHPDLATDLDRALGADGQLLELAAREAVARTTLAEPDADSLTIVDAILAEPGRPLDADDVGKLHETIGHLVALDNAHGADDIANLAVRTYRTADRALAAGTVAPGAERGLQAVAGELAELAGWLLYDADRQDDARRLSTEALLASRLAGDRGVELFTLSNLAMQSIHLGRGREALRIADAVLATDRLSGRVAALFHARRGRALAMLGDRDEALAELALARSMLLDGIAANDPRWAWWVDDAELVAYEGMAHQALGEPGAAADLLRESVDTIPAGKVRGRYSYLAFLLDVLVDAGAWRDAERVVAELRPYVGAVGSARMTTLLRRIAGRISRSPEAPESLKFAVQTWSTPHVG